MKVVVEVKSRSTIIVRGLVKEIMRKRKKKLYLLLYSSTMSLRGFLGVVVVSEVRKEVVVVGEVEIDKKEKLKVMGN